MKTAEEHLLIFEGASDGRYPQRSRPSEQRIKNREMAPALCVAAITGRRLRRLRALLARRRCYASVTATHCGDARAKPPCRRPLLASTVSMRLNQCFPWLFDPRQKPPTETLVASVSLIPTWPQF